MNLQEWRTFAFAIIQEIAEDEISQADLLRRFDGIVLFLTPYPVVQQALYFSCSHLYGAYDSSGYQMGLGMEHWFVGGWRRTNRYQELGVWQALMDYCLEHQPLITIIIRSLSRYASYREWLYR